MVELDSQLWEYRNEQSAHIITIDFALTREVENDQLELNATKISLFISLWTGDDALARPTGTCQDIQKHLHISRSKHD